jgi:phosphoglycolate phosphatase-like HAD superfamily hydrolase
MSFNRWQPMNLVMLDIDGTLTQSYEYDQEIFGLAIAEVIHCPPVDADLNRYVEKTSSGVTEEAIQRLTGRSPTSEQVKDVQRRVLQHLERMYRESPQIFIEVPGAGCFLERLRSLDGMGIAIATGCWRSEALFKLKASGLSVEGIPFASSDDNRNRLKIMELATRRALEFYGCPGFERIVYLGDGTWDLQTSRSLGYGFIGIGPRVQLLVKADGGRWHPDFLDIEAVFASIAATQKP